MIYIAYPGIYKPGHPFEKDADELVYAASRYFGFEQKIIRYSKNRKTEFVFARQLIMYVLKKRKGWSLVRIANYFEKDHTTVIASIRSIQNYLDTDHQIRVDQINYFLHRF